MGSISKQILSGSSDGRLIKVVRTATPGDLIHTAVSRVDTDEIWLYAVNSNPADVKLTIEWGGVQAPDDLIEKTIPAESGLEIVVAGRLVQMNELVIRAFANAAHAVLIGGFVNRLEPEEPLPEFPNVLDRSGNGLDGTMTNMVIGDCVVDSPGGGDFSENSVLLPGANEFITMGDVLGFEYDEACSFSVWFKTTYAASNQTLLSKQTGAGTWRGYNFYLTPGGNLRIDWNSNSGGANVVAGNTNVGGWNDGNWHHGCLTKGVLASAASFTFYLDGGVEPWTATLDALTGTILTATDFQVGARDVPGSEREFEGNLCECSVYDKELSLAEVQALYNAGVPKNLLTLDTASDLVAWWRPGEPPP